MRFHVWILLLIICPRLGAQQLLPCRSAEAMTELYRQHPEAIEKSSEKTKAAMKTDASAEYVIPMVFHVYDSVQGGLPVNQDIIQGALDMLNNDFHGLSADFAMVNDSFLSRRGTLDIEFALAKLDPNGNPTNGVVMHPYTAGYGNSGTYDAQIAADAWDNYRYMNVYLMHDLYNDGVTNNSGIAWYPNSWMSDNGLARIVYNGYYLGENPWWDPDFAGVFTHEVGHFFNLMHTFELGCSHPLNDEVDDTPPCEVAQGCHASSASTLPLNCDNQLVNSENFMDYNSCYRMFTQGQMERIEEALYHPARFPLWQEDNLIATGLYEPSTAVTESETKAAVFQLAVNPAAALVYLMHPDLKTSYRLSMYNAEGRLCLQQDILQSGTALNVSALADGLYLLNLQNAIGEQQQLKYLKY